jgi:hypothetical protein
MRRFTPALYVIALLFAACGGETESTAGEQAPTGQVGGVCYGNGSCNEGLVCTSGYCIPEGPQSDVLVPDAQNDVEAPEPDVQEVVDTAGPDAQEVVDTAGPDAQEVVDTAGPDAQEVVDTGTPESDCPALFFDGVDDYVTAASTIEYASEFTVELWTKFESAPHTWNYLFTHEGPVMSHIGMQAEGLTNGGVRIMVSQVVVANQLVPEAEIYFQIGTATGKSAPVLPNSWSHVALVYANGTATGYLDGAEIVAFSASSPGASTSGATVRIGGEAPMPGAGGLPQVELNKKFGYHGSIRHVRISSVPRYLAPFTPLSGLTVDADTVALWPLDDGEGTTAADSGSQGFDAAVEGAMWVGVDGLECTQE